MFARPGMFIRINMVYFIQAISYSKFKDKKRTNSVDP